MIFATRLIDLPAGQTALVVGVTGARALISRLASLGFTPGTPVMPVRNGGPGPVIVLVRDTRVVLGRSEATHVQVTMPAGSDAGDDER